MSVPDYKNIIDMDILEATFFDWLDSTIDDIRYFAKENSSEIHTIYQAIRDNCRKTVFVVDTNLVFHSYADYLKDMGEYMDKLYESDPSKLETQDVREVVNRLFDKDAQFYTTVSTKQEERISDAMKSIEIVIELPEFAEKIKEDFAKKFKDGKKIEYAKLYASSVSNFYDSLYESLVNTLEIIIGTLDGTIAQNEELTKESVFKMF